MALTAGAPSDLFARRAGADAAPDRAASGTGLGVVPELAVIPHFDQMERWSPGAAQWFAAWQPPGTTLIGIDEQTALVGAPGRWRVEGTGSVWELAGEARTEHRPAPR